MQRVKRKNPQTRSGRRIRSRRVFPIHGSGQGRKRYSKVRIYIIKVCQCCSQCARTCSNYLQIHNRPTCTWYFSAALIHVCIGLPNHTTLAFLVSTLQSFLDSFLGASNTRSNCCPIRLPVWFPLVFGTFASFVVRLLPAWVRLLQTS